MTTFADQVATATAPWNDPNGFWAAYNAALASMFESVFSIVSDQGDPNQTTVATLSAPLSTAGPVSTLPVQSVAEVLSAGQEVTLAFAQSSQAFKLSVGAAVGATTIHVAPLTPNFAYPVGTPVQLAYVPGWSNLLDPNNCPDQFLTYLGQFNGTAIPPTLDPTTARAKIVGESAQQRGTLASVVSAVQRNLTGTQSVVVEERVDGSGNPNAYWFVVIVRPEEAGAPAQTITNASVANPGPPLSALIDSVNAVKPGGVQWTLVLTDGWTISQVESSQATITALEGNFVTITGLEQDRPGT